MKKTKKEARSADSMYQHLTSKKKAGYQNSGEDIAIKLDFEEEPQRSTDDAGKDSAKKNAEKIANAVVQDYIRRKKIRP